MSPLSRFRFAPCSLSVASLLLAFAGCGGDAHDAQPPAPATDPEPSVVSIEPDVSPSPSLPSRPVLAAPSEVSVDQGDPVAVLRRDGRGRVQVIYFPADGWAYHGANGRLTGVNIEILRDFFRWVEAREGVDIDVTWSADEDWARLYRRIRNGADGVFGVANVTITDERRTELDFSPPYLNNIAVLITHEDVPEIESMEDAPVAFEDFTAHPYRGTLHEERMNRLRERRIPGFRVMPVESNEELLETISKGPGRLAWIDVHAYWRAVERGLPIRRHPAGDDSSETFGVMLPRGSDWTPLIEAFFNDGEGFRNLPRYGEILREHLGEGLAELLRGAGLDQDDERFD